MPQAVSTPLNPASSYRFPQHYQAQTSAEAKICAPSRHRCLETTAAARSPLYRQRQQPMPPSR